MTDSLRVKRRFTLGLGFACFIAQGIANGMLGVAWPSVRASFGLPLDSLVMLLTSSTIGYVLGSVFAGQIMARIGIGWFLMIGNILAAVGYLGYAIAPSWIILILLGLITGWTSGSIVASLNIFVASTRTVRTMNWMHAMYGIGATIGPLVMTAAIGSRLGWRLGYGIAAQIHLFLGFLFISVLRQMNFKGMVMTTEAKTGVKVGPAKTSDTLRIPIVLLGFLLFIFYTGVETTTGQLAYSLFTEERSISTYVAGILASVYWGMLTVGRMVFGAAANRMGITRLLRWSMAGTVISSALFILRSPIASLASVTLMGLSLAAIFPTLMSDTPNRVGNEHVATAISFQNGAASLGLAILPGLAGVLAARVGLEVLGIYLLIASSLMLLTNEATLRLAIRNKASLEQAPVA